MMRYPGGDASPDVDLGRVWVAVAGEVWARRPGPVERVAARLLRSPGLARALLTTPSLLIGWLLATVAVLGVGVAVTLSTGTALVPLLAPALAGAGVAYAYGPGTDPAYELARSMPVGDRMVLLARALCVCLVNAVLGVAATAISGAAAVITFGWLIPMTAVCALALAVATVVRSAPAGVTAGLAGWTVVVLAGMAAHGPAATAVTDTRLYLPYLAVAVLGAVTVRLAKGTP